VKQHSGGSQGLNLVVVQEKDERGDMRQNRHEGREGRGKNYIYIYLIFGCLGWRQENKEL
jgi:hypothetical protein